MNRTDPTPEADAVAALGGDVARARRGDNGLLAHAGRFGTAPVLQRVGLFFGIFAGFYSLWKLTRVSSRGASDPSTSNGPPKETEADAKSEPDTSDFPDSSDVPR